MKPADIFLSSFEPLDQSGVVALITKIQQNEFVTRHFILTDLPGMLQTERLILTMPKAGMGSIFLAGCPRLADNVPHSASLM